MDAPLVARKRKTTDTVKLEPTDDDKIIAEAKERMKKVLGWESVCRQRFVDDTKFYNGDSYNGYQWEGDLLRTRVDDDRPSLTINKTRVFCMLITNDAKKNLPNIKVVATGGSATKESAEVYEGLVRHIEYKSKAEDVYDNAMCSQVQGGWGCWRVVTEYADTDSFNQSIFIRAIKDPLTVCLDPDTKMPDKSDARWAIVFEDMPRERFEEEYPEYKGKLPRSTLDTQGWVTDKSVRVAEYYRKAVKKDKLIAIEMPNGTPRVFRESKVSGDERAKLLKDITKINEREIEDTVIEWFKIAGDDILMKTTSPGQYIPVVMIVGEETVIEGELDRKGHVRALADPQRMYNYNASAAVEFGALQTKTPWVAPTAAIEEFEEYWNTANVKNYSVLPYKHRDGDGNDIPQPTRPGPPQTSPAYEQGMQNSGRDMMMVSGQHQAMLGQETNERTGKALLVKQRQGDTSTYHFIDGLARGIYLTGKIIIDMIPFIYDTQRVVRILHQDGSEQQITVDPQQQQALIQQMNRKVEAVIFNPTVGKYDIQVDVGPGYETRRQEAFQAISEVLSFRPELAALIGDLLFQAADFPMSKEIAERLKRMVPPQALNDQPPPELAQLAQKLDAAQQINSALMQQLLAKDEEVARAKDSTDTNAYKAVTERLKNLGVTDPTALLALITDAVMQGLEIKPNTGEENAKAGAPLGGGQTGQGDSGGLLRNGGGPQPQMAPAAS